MIILEFGDGDYRIGFEPTPFEKQRVLDLPRSWEGFGNVVTEYVKIGWFLIYEPFLEN